MCLGIQFSPVAEKFCYKNQFETYTYYFIIHEGNNLHFTVRTSKYNIHIQTK